MSQTPPAQSTRPPMSGKALLSLVMAVMCFPLSVLISLVYFFWADLPRPVVFLLMIGYWIVATVLGVLAVRETGKGRQRGRGLAVAALVILVVVGGYVASLLLT